MLSNKRALSRRPRPVAGSLAVALCWLALAVAGCGDEPRKAEAETASPVPVMAAKPVVRNIPLALEVTGTTQAVQSAAIVARVEGTLRKVAYEDGALVREGDILFVIDPDAYAARLRQAEATLAAQRAVRNRAAVELTRNRKLYAEQAASQATVVSWREQLGNAEAQVAAAEAAVAQARIELGYTVIRAPFTGRVSRHMADVGSTVGPQTGTLATIVSQDPIYAEFTAPAVRVLPLLRSFDNAGAVPLELSVGEGPFSLAGRLDYMAPQVDASSGTLAMRGVFPNPDGKLLPGLFVRIRLTTGDLRATPVIPRQAVLESQGKAFVFVVGADNTARMLPVTTGPAVGTDEIAVTEGITPDMRVIYDGMARLRPGQPVVDTAGRR